MSALDGTPSLPSALATRSIEDGFELVPPLAGPALRLLGQFGHRAAHAADLVFGGRLIYDLGADEASQVQVNIQGTRNAVSCCMRSCCACRRSS
ncbi:hypothetical protein [Methylibium sp.]|uniref:hypothetical protein n=1 Tax=Methylibium sp. TaxID=2067992 RepID=UPI002869F0F2|nr:hypothetical protein [Methylibium sp.]